MNRATALRRARACDRRATIALFAALRARDTGRAFGPARAVGTAGSLRALYLAQARNHLATVRTLARCAARYRTIGVLS